MSDLYPEYFNKYIFKGIELGILDSQLKTFDLETLGKAIKPARDFQFTYS